MLKKLNPKVKAGCGVGCIFGLGFFAGLITMFVVIVTVVQNAEGWKTKESKEFVASHFANQLKLDEAQRVKFQPIVDEVLEKRWELRRDYFKENREVIEEYMPQVNEFLTEEQKRKAQKMIDKWLEENAFKIEKPKATNLEP